MSAPVPIGLGFWLWTALGLGLGLWGMDFGLGLGLDTIHLKQDEVLLGSDCLTLILMPGFLWRLIAAELSSPWSRLCAMLYSVRLGDTCWDHKICSERSVLKEREALLKPFFNTEQFSSVSSSWRLPVTYLVVSGLWLAGILASHWPEYWPPIGQNTGLWLAKTGLVTCGVRRGRS